MMVSRRVLLAGPLLGAMARGAGKGPKLALSTGTSPRLLQLASQLGIGWADMGQRPAKLPAPGQYPKGEAVGFTRERLEAMKGQVEKFGLRMGTLMLHQVPNALLGNARRDRDIAVAQESIRLAGQVGIPVVEYNWMLLRPSAGYFEATGRGGAGLRGFDYERIARDEAIAEAAGLTVEEIWKRFEYFLRAVAPVAEKAGVRLSLHPNDPPVAAYRGVPQAIRTGEDLKRVVGLVNSPANGITLDTGVMHEAGGNAVELIRYFGRRGRIHHVHFRNVRRTRVFEQYTETFPDDGEVNMKAAMRALVETGYERCVVPDHVPHLANDSEDQLAAWSYAVGYMRALLAE